VQTNGAADFVVLYRNIDLGKNVRLISNSIIINNIITTNIIISNCISNNIIITNVGGIA